MRISLNKMSYIMALKDKNTFKDLAVEWERDVRTIRRWFKRWAMQFKLKVLRPSSRTIYVERAEAERFGKFVQSRWGNEDWGKVKKKKSVRRA